MNKAKIPAFVVAYIVAEESNDKHSKQVHCNSMLESSAIEKENGRIGFEGIQSTGMVARR